MLPGSPTLLRTFLCAALTPLEGFSVSSSPRATRLSLLSSGVAQAASQRLEKAQAPPRLDMLWALQQTRPQSRAAQEQPAGSSSSEVLRLRPLGLRILWPGTWFSRSLYFCISVKYCCFLVPFPLHAFLVGNLKESERNACPWFSVINQSSGGFPENGQQACPSLTTGTVLPSECPHVLGTFPVALLAFWASCRG